MRYVMILLILVFSIFSNAQSSSESLEGNSQTSFSRDSISGERHLLSSKWSTSFYWGMSTGFSFFNGGNAMVFSAPVGWQLNRRLTNNVFAFAGISIAPSYINFNHSFLYSDVGKVSPAYGIRSNNFGVYSRAEMGLMYVNDARTFSISGSVDVQRSTNPLFLYQPINGARANQVFMQR
ncbi:MAG TPA: hypothetical protein VKR32_16345 [Puia sp.]|nr:hypothetical protein [Puia sp.]